MARDGARTQRPATGSQLALVLILGLLSVGAPVSQAARLLHDDVDHANMGRELQQASCSATNVYFVQDAACQFNVGSNNNIGLWTTVISHNCPRDLAALTMQVSIGYPNPIFVESTLGPFSGLSDCAIPFGGGQIGLCQLSDRTIYQGPYQNTDSATIELGHLPLSSSSQYSIWYLSSDHPCGSTNLAPFYFSVKEASFVGDVPPTPPPTTSTPVLGGSGLPTTPPSFPPNLPLTGSQTVSPTVAPTGPPTVPPTGLPTVAPTAQPTVPPTAASSPLPAATTPVPTVAGPTPSPTISGGVPFQKFPDTALNAQPQAPPGSSLSPQCPGGGFPFGFGDGQTCFEHCVFNVGAHGASFVTGTGCCFCYPAATVADVGAAGGAPGTNTFVLAA